MPILQTHIVPEGISKIRLSDYACQVFSIIPSRKGIKKAIKRGEIRVNGKEAKTGLWVEAGQKIELIDSELPAPKRYEIPLEVVYEDEHLALINKPSGISVSGNQFKTVQNALADNLKPSKEADALKRFRPVHRLDNPTSGLLLIAKTARAQINLSRQFENKTIKKRYRAIAIGALPESGLIDQLIENKKASTRFSLVQKVPSLKSKWLSLVDLFPLTGRTHQLRIHLSDSGYPILGDKLYGKEGLILKNKGLFLAAVELSFLHPFHQTPMKIKIEEPAKFKVLLEREERRWGKYN